MSEKSNIEWTDATWNPVRGCVKVSPGCVNCYAETFAERFRGVPGHPYEQGFDLRLVPEKLTEPLKWKTPKRIFVNSMSDLFQDGVPDEFIDQVFAVMALAPQHTFQVLTKRAERMRDYLMNEDTVTRIEEQLWARHTDETTNAMPLGPLPNVWLGVSVENQHFADERIPLLLQTPAAVRFISAEPLLGPVDLDQFVWPGCIRTRTEHDAECGGGMWCDERSLDWVIIGLESGGGARAGDIAWVRALVKQCESAGVAKFVKQLGAKPYDGLSVVDSHRKMLRLGSRKGGDPSEWPEDLRVREFPKGIA